MTYMSDVFMTSMFLRKNFWAREPFTGSYSLPSNGKLENGINYTTGFTQREHFGYNYSLI